MIRRCDAFLIDKISKLHQVHFLLIKRGGAFLIDEIFKVVFDIFLIDESIGPLDILLIKEMTRLFVNKKCDATLIFYQ